MKHILIFAAILTVACSAFSASRTNKVSSALTPDKKCAVCNGTKKIEQWTTCTVCKGKGVTATGSYIRTKENRKSKFGLRNTSSNDKKMKRREVPCSGCRGSDKPGQICTKIPCPECSPKK